MTVETVGFTPDAEVVVCDDAGDSLSAFYQAEYPRLVGALTLYCGDRELATELAQEAMARAWRLWPRVRKFNSPAGWVHRVGINLANSAYRRAIVRRRFQDAHPAGDEGVAAPDIGTALALRAAVAALPQRQRTALVLRYFVDLPVDQVADIMRCRPGTVRALTTQAINSLRATGGLGDVEVSS
jgi:RNA polymerase sigma-70 factor (ECF subfamily)